MSEPESEMQGIPKRDVRDRVLDAQRSLRGYGPPITETALHALLGDLVEQLETSREYLRWALDEWQHEPSIEYRPKLDAARAFLASNPASEPEAS